MAWAKPTGAWAQAVEDEEAESGPIHVPVVKGNEFPALGNAKEDADFPTLGAAGATGKAGAAGGGGGKKGKKGGKKVMSLADFVTKTDAPAPGTFVPSARAGAIGRRGFADDIMLNLPTSSRGKVEGEESAEDSKLGGAFRGDRQGREDRPGRQAEDMGPSRADLADDWGAERKFVSGGGGLGGGFGGRDRRGGGGFARARSPGGERDPLEPSRADAAGDWGASRQFVPSATSDSRPGSGGPGPRRYDEPREPSRADTEDRWERSATGAGPTGFDDRGPRGGFDDRAPRGGFGGGDRDRNWGGSGYGNGWAAPRQGFRSDSPARSGSRERDNWRSEDPAPGSEPAGPPAPLLSIPPGATRGSSRASVFGAARPREEVLAEKGVTGEGAVERLEAEIAAATEHLAALRASDAQADTDATVPAADDDVIQKAEAELEGLCRRLEMVKKTERVEEEAAPASSEPAGRVRGGSPARREAEVDAKSSWRRETELPAAALKEERGRGDWNKVGHFRDRQKATAGAAPEGGEEAKVEGGAPGSEGGPVRARREAGRDRFWGAGSNRGGAPPPRASAGGGW